MSINRLSNAIANAISNAFKTSVDPATIEKNISQRILKNGADSFSVQKYIDDLLELNSISLNDKLHFRVRWLPILQIMTFNGMHKTSYSKVEPFETAIERALSTTNKKVSAEFNVAWNEFQKNPTSLDSHLLVMSELKKLGVHGTLISMLNEVWVTLFNNNKSTLIKKNDQIKMASVTSPNETLATNVITQYEAIDGQNRTLHILTPAPADAINVSLAGYRINELRTAHENITRSPISILSIYPGSNPKSSFEQSLAKGLLGMGVRVNIQNLSHPNIPKLEQFYQNTSGEKHVIIFKVKGNANKVDNAATLAFLKNRFLKKTEKGQTSNRIVFMIDTEGMAAKPAISRLVPFIRQILSEDTHIPALGINIKYLNERQAGELLFGTNAWNKRNVDGVKRIIAHINKELPMIPEVLANLRPVIVKLNSVSQIIAAITDYATKFRMPKPDQKGLLLTSMLPTDDSSWYQSRLIDITEKKGYTVQQTNATASFNKLSVNIKTQTNDSSNVGKLSAENSTDKQASLDAKDFAGFFDLASKQQSNKRTMINMLEDEEPSDEFIEPHVISTSATTTANPLTLKAVEVSPKATPK